MANTYNWVIALLECAPKQGDKTNVVTTIHWRRQATDGKGHNGDVFGQQNIALDPNAPFTPYDQLTKAQVEGWLTSAMGASAIAALDAALDKQIADQITPPVSTPALPW